MSEGILLLVECLVLLDSLGVWGSDVFVDMLWGLGVKYVVLNFGLSFWGLYDSFVNYFGNEDL